MAAPKRPRKPAKAAEEKSTPQVEVNEEAEIMPDVQEEKVDKDALIKELQSQLRSQEDQAKAVADLQKQLKEAEDKAGDTANTGDKEFKLRPEPGVDSEKFFYFEIIWHPKRSDSDEEFVTIGVNGKMMIWPRNKKTVVRSDYLEVADNAFVPKFKQLPGEERKEIGGLKPYTYAIQRKITEEEYTKRKADGDKALRDDLASKGMSL